VFFSDNDGPISTTKREEIESEVRRCAAVPRFHFSLSFPAFWVLLSFSPPNSTSLLFLGIIASVPGPHLSFIQALIPAKLTLLKSLSICLIPLALWLFPSLPPLSSHSHTFRISHFFLAPSLASLPAFSDFPTHYHPSLLIAGESRVNKLLKDKEQELHLVSHLTHMLSLIQLMPIQYLNVLARQCTHGARDSRPRRGKEGYQGRVHPKD
jgi:hypothetical protein